MSADRARRRAERLTRLYPRRWRVRYGAEFVELLVEEMAERPRSAKRALDIARFAAERLEACGLVGEPGAGTDCRRAGLNRLACAAAVFAPAGVAVWSQLTIGWQWSAPGAAATRAGMLLMSGALVVFATWAVLALAPLAFAIVRSLRGPHMRSLAVPAGITALAAAVLVAGSLHFDGGWPGAGGHPWHGRALVPAAVARFCWAGTVWITSYWAHPAALARFPAVELAWMALSPIATVSAIVGLARAVAVLRPGARLLAYEARLGAIAVGAMIVFAAGAASWLMAATPGPQQLFSTGAIDVTAVVLMLCTTTIAARAVGDLIRSRDSSRPVA
jgi:hypothetical protein